MTVKSVLNVAQMFVKLHLISPTGLIKCNSAFKVILDDLQGHPRSLEMAIDRPYMILPISSV